MSLRTNGVNQLPDAEGVADGDLVTISREGRWRKLLAGSLVPSAEALAGVLGTLGIYPSLNSPTLRVGPSRPYATIGAAIIALEGKRINGIATIKVDDGIYNEPQLFVAHPDGARIRLVGNTTNPFLCRVNFSALNNLSGVAVPFGFALGLVDGFQFVGNGGRLNESGLWAANAYGAGVYAQGSAVTVGPNMRVTNFYYSYLSDKGGIMVVQAGAEGANAGDCVFHAREQSYMLCAGCKAFGARHEASTGESFGSGFAQEANSFMDCSRTYATGCYTGGYVSGYEGMMWAKGVTAENNPGHGILTFGGGIDCGPELVAGISTVVRGSGRNGLFVVNGGKISASHFAPYIMLVENNVADGVRIEDDGSTFKGSGISFKNNGGYGAYAAQGGRGRSLSSEYVGNGVGATGQDSGFNSAFRTT